MRRLANWAIAFLMTCAVATPALATTTTTTTEPGACSPYADVVNLPTGPGTYTGTTSGTSHQKGTCAYTRSAPEIVYKWVAPASGSVTVETCGGDTDFNTVVYVRRQYCRSTGKAPNDSSPGEIACSDPNKSTDTCDDKNGVKQASTTSFTAVSGKTYYIIVDGVKKSKGHFTLTLSGDGTATTTTTTVTTTTTTSGP